MNTVTSKRRAHSPLYESSDSRGALRSVKRKRTSEASIETYTEKKRKGPETFSSPQWTIGEQLDLEAEFDSAFPGPPDEQYAAVHFSSAQYPLWYAERTTDEIVELKNGQLLSSTNGETKETVIPPAEGNILTY